MLSTASSFTRPFGGSRMGRSYLNGDTFSIRRPLMVGRFTSGSQRVRKSLVLAALIARPIFDACRLIRSRIDCKSAGETGLHNVLRGLRIRLMDGETQLEAYLADYRITHCLIESVVEQDAEIGQPCLIPDCIANFEDLQTYIRTCVLVDES